jgi:hypothetical protein
MVNRVARYGLRVMVESIDWSIARVPNSQPETQNS